MSIVSRKSGGIGVITFDRPEKLNAFNDSMYSEFAQTLGSWNKSSDLCAIVVQGSEGNFSSGTDIDELSSLSNGNTWTATDLHQGPAGQAVEALINLDIPIIAALEGKAVGFGATMLLHFDFIVMATDAYIHYPFVDIGVVPEACSTLLLAQCVGELSARRLLLDPSPISVREALRLNLVTDECETGEAYIRSMEIAERLAGRSHLAIKATKRLLLGDTNRLRSRAVTEFESFAQCLNSEYVKVSLN